MAPIRQLDPSLVNKIAAGEVIERPASVVKELVENALDAEATRIDISLEDGGATLIRVCDNGLGIPGDQLALAIAPHATNKIATSEDLFNIHTLGFRGEALASIASVSRFRIVSRTAEQLEGNELRLDCVAPEPLRISDCGLGIDQAGLPRDPIRNPKSEIRDGAPRACAAPVGTAVEVRNLFYNVPARRKFLRQPSTELANVTEQLARLALAHPQAAFTLTSNGRQLRNLPPTADRKVRIADFYGPELAECLWPVQREERSLKIDALIAPPAQSRASTKWQYLFLNGRFISDRRIAFAVREAYRGLVEHDRFPVVFLFLTTSPDAFDVNVHPTKIEVRWRDAGLVQSQVLALLRETLLSRDLTPRLGIRDQGLGVGDFGDPMRQGWENGANSSVDDERTARTRQALADYLRSVDPTQARLRFSPPPFPSGSVRASIGSTHAPRMEEGIRDQGLGTRDSTPPRERESPVLHPQSPTPAPASPADFSTFTVLQVHNTYIVAETDEGLVIIDQHALHERILYERFRNRILAGPLESQRLLVPAAFEASPEQVQSAGDHHDLLARLGIEVSAFGPGTLAVQSFPTLLPDIDASSFVSDLLDKLGESARTQATTGPGAEESLLHQALDMMACKAAVKAGDPLTMEEMHALLVQRHLTQRSSNCPHGRPTTLELTTRDLEKQFKRI